MGTVGSSLWVCLPTALLCSYAQAETFSVPEMVSCSAHFQARSNWMLALRKSPDTIKFMSDHAEILLQAANEAVGPSDWRMSTGFGSPSGPLTYDGVQYGASLSEMTRFAELGYGDTVLPLCVEDETCIRCTHLLNEIVK